MNLGKCGREAIYSDFSVVSHKAFEGRKEKHMSVTMISNAEVASVALRKSRGMWRGDAQPNGHKARRAKGSPYFSG